MMFSTKAEYGVRVMVELARRAGEEPIPLAEIAEHGGLPLAYLEHLVARLRKAGLVDSRRGSRGGYLLARSPTEITMAEIVAALEGSIAPIECITEGSDGSIVCSRETDPAHVCPTKLLWTRVRFSIVRTLQEMTLADLVLGPALPAGPSLPSGPHWMPHRKHLRPELETENMADLEIRDLHVRIEEREILKGVDLDISRGEIHALMGPNGSGKSTLASTLMGHPSYEITEGTITFKGEDLTGAEPHERAKAGLFLAFQYPVSIPGVSVANFLRMAINAKRDEPIQVKEFRNELQHAIELLDVDKAFTSRHLNDGFSGGEKKRAEILQMAMLDAGRGDPRRDRLGPGHRRAAHGRRGRAAPARRAGPGRADHHALPAHPALRKARVRAHPDGRAHRAGGRRGARRAPGARGL